jgi:O-acetyl-ADP-ribose deacetylase (regulator of RNase III)
MRLGGRTEEAALRSSVKHSFRLAGERGLASIALPAIGAGIAGFPLQRCAEVLIEETARELEGEGSLQEIRFVLFGDQAAQTFKRAWRSAQVAGGDALR